MTLSTIFEEEGQIEEAYELANYLPLSYKAPDEWATWHFFGMLLNQTTIMASLKLPFLFFLFAVKKDDRGRDVYEQLEQVIGR